MNIQIDDTIRQRPELLESVNKANAYLEELAGTSSTALRVEWRLVPHDDRLIELGVFDEHAGIRPTFHTNNLLDPVNRKLRLLSTWDYILQQRSERNLAVIRQQINQLEQEEWHGGQDTDRTVQVDPQS